MAIRQIWRDHRFPHRLEIQDWAMIIDLVYYLATNLCPHEGL